MSQRHPTQRQTTTKLTAAAGILTMLFGALLVFAPSAGAANNDTQEWDLTYIGLTVAEGDSTFRYQLVRTPLSDDADTNKLSHMTVGGFCADPIDVQPAFTPNEGNKWDSADLVKSGDFYDITFAGDYTDAVDPEGSIWTLKKGNGEFSEKVITTSGPDCDTTPPCDPLTDVNQCEEPCDPLTDVNQCEEPCVEDDIRPACSPPPPLTCVELGNCPAPPPVVEDADLTIVKVVLNGPEEWSFPFAGDLGTFDLTHLDGDESFEDVDAGAYSITEADSGIATLASIECDEDADVTVDLDAATVTVDLAEGDDVTCTFTNVYDVNVLPESRPIAETPPVKVSEAPRAPLAAPTEEVLGVTVTRTLPRTGSSSTGTLALAGGALMLLGAALVGGSRRLQPVR